MVQSTHLRKKSFFQKWRQIRRIVRKAKLGPPAGAVSSELAPIIQRILDEESIAAHPSVEINEAVRKHARAGAIEERELLLEKIHQLSLKRALTMSKIFSIQERRNVRNRMDAAVSAIDYSRIMENMNYLQNKLGRKFPYFLKIYQTTNEAIKQYCDLVMLAMKK